VRSAAKKFNSGNVLGGQKTSTVPTFFNLLIRAPSRSLRYYLLLMMMMIIKIKIHVMFAWFFLLTRLCMDR